MVHCDIKPDNIQVLPGDSVKLTDFGIARIAADPSITADGQVFGTPSYMSPEQVAAAGCAPMLLAGRHPYDAQRAQAVYRRGVVTITYTS